MTECVKRKFNIRLFCCVPEQETQAKPDGVSFSQEEGVQVSITPTVSFSFPDVDGIIDFVVLLESDYLYILLNQAQEGEKEGQGA